MEIQYIKREKIKVDITRLNKKTKRGHRYKAKAHAPICWDNSSTTSDITGHTSCAWRSVTSSTMSGRTVYSKTKEGARISAIKDLLHQCRPPLTKKEKREVRNGSANHQRSVRVEVRISNAMDFIMNDSKDKDSTWNEIREIKPNT